ncbi:MAG: formate dehydrogenase accessory sulfurtransferase FdhD [Verrucomicrobia bacterium]|nr:formate dehydrogenase accessory sulfurtransferase FdhD [Verrucomicrobiota bacterium]
MKRVRIVRHRRGTPARPALDQVAGEEPLEIRVDSRPIAVVMRTPGHDEELALGFLVSEGLIRNREDVRTVRPNVRNRSGNSIDVLLAPEVQVDFQRLTRHVFASSSCGLCGSASIAAVRRQYPALTRPLPTPDPERLLGLPEAMRLAQTEFSRTGGLHAASWFRMDGSLQAVREDVGRHNAVDKLLGWALREGSLPLRELGLLVSGRVSFEIVQKALAGGVGVIAAVSAPTSLAVEFARRNGQTLVGFLRDGRFNVYSGKVRAGKLRAES